MSELRPFTEDNTFTGVTRQQMNNTVLDPKDSLLLPCPAKVDYFLSGLADDTKAWLLMGQVWRAPSNGKEHPFQVLQLLT